MLQTHQYVTLFTKVLKVTAKNIHLLPTQHPDFTTEYRIELIDADRRFGRRSYDCIAPYITTIRIWRVVFKTLSVGELSIQIYSIVRILKCLGEWWLVHLACLMFGLFSPLEIASEKYDVTYPQNECKCIELSLIHFIGLHFDVISFLNKQSLWPGKYFSFMSTTLPAQDSQE